MWVGRLSRHLYQRWQPAPSSRVPPASSVLQPQCGSNALQASVTAVSVSLGQAAAVAANAMPILPPAQPAAAAANAAPLLPPAQLAAVPLFVELAPGAPMRSPPRARRPHPPPPPPARRSKSCNRSLLACTACKWLRRGPDAPPAVECPLCFCEVDGEHTHLDCAHAYRNGCLSHALHAAYQRQQHPTCQLAGCGVLLSEEDLQQGVLTLCGCPEVAQQRASGGLPVLGEPGAVYNRFIDLAAAAVARGGGELIECLRCGCRMLAEEDAPEDVLCPGCRVGRPILEAREAAQRPKGVQLLEGGERVLYCPACSFGLQQKAMYCGEVIGEQRAYDHFSSGRCPLYGLPGERPQVASEEVEQAQQAAVQREQYYQALWAPLVHPAHNAVRAMRRSTPADLQQEEQLWRRVAQTMHVTLERVFNEITEAAAAERCSSLLRSCASSCWTGRCPRWPGGWDVWDGVVATVMGFVQDALR